MNAVELKSEADLYEWITQHKSLLAGKIVRLHGDMGAGKTTLVRLYLSLVILENESASSPTFALHHQYKTSIGPIDHVDLYRLEDEGALEAAGFWDILKQTRMMFVEWPERVPEHLWPNSLQYVDLFLEVKPSGRFLRWLSLGI